MNKYTRLLVHQSIEELDMAEYMLIKELVEQSLTVPEEEIYKTPKPSQEEVVESLVLIESVIDTVGRYIEKIGNKIPDELYDDLSLYGCNLLDLEQEIDTITSYISQLESKVNENNPIFKEIIDEVGTDKSMCIKWYHDLYKRIQSSFTNNKEFHNENT